MRNVKVTIGSSGIKNDLDNVAITIDTFRCNSMIITALSKGASVIYPALTVKEAFKLSARIKDAVLIGERRGKKLEGFDFGNSPTQLRTEDVKGRPVILTTTNGTRLIIEASKRVDSLLIGGILNASACSRYANRISNDYKNIRIIVPLGRSDLYLEDLYTAGLITNILVDLGFKVLGDTTRIASITAENLHSDTSILTRSFSARRITELGYGDDVEYCIKQDLISIVPILDKEYGVIVKPG